MNRLFWPLTPDMPSSVQRDPDRGGTMGGGTRCERFDAAQSRRLHHGMTVAERVAAGVGSPEDNVAVEADQQAHREWCDSPAGRAWLEAQPWWNVSNP